MTSPTDFRNNKCCNFCNLIRQIKETFVCFWHRLYPKVMNVKISKFECYKCKTFKVKDAFDETQFKGIITRKMCLKCEIKRVQAEEADKRMKMELEASKKLKAAEKKVSYIQSLKFSTHEVLPHEFRSDKFGQVWMKKEDPYSAYKQERGTYVKYRNITCKFTNKTKIVVDYKYGGKKWYELDKMYQWIYPEVLQETENPFI